MIEIEYLLLIILGGGSALAGIIYLGIRSFQSWEKEKQERDAYENEIAAKEKQAQDIADTPAGDDDFHARMRNRINAKPD